MMKPTRPWLALGRLHLASCFTVAEYAVGSLAVLAVLLLPIGVGFVLLGPVAAALRAISDRARGWARRWSGMAVGQPEALPAAGSRSRGAMAKHIASMFAKLDIAASNDVNRRVLAVLAYLNR